MGAYFIVNSSLRDILSIASITKNKIPNLIVDKTKLILLLLLLLLVKET